ncbi:MAG: Flagellin [Pseudomonadota bacterium]|jgi:flagellin
MSVINTNVKSLIAQNALTVNNRSLSKAMEQLSTGKRINTAADDAAGLAISDKMTSQIRGLNQAVRNANDGISLVQTVEGATQEVTNMLQRMRELAVQSSNDTYSSTDRSALQLEFDQLTEEISRISTNTRWNNMQVFASGSAGIGSAFAVSLQVGMHGNSSDTITVTLQSITASALSVSGLSLASHTSAAGVLSTIDSAIQTIDTFRANLGAWSNRLTYAADNLSNVSQNTAASRSRILDADYAAESTELARTQIIQQAATAMLAQANQQPQSVLTLLR